MTCKTINSSIRCNHENREGDGDGEREQDQERDNEGYIYEVTPVLHRHRILRAFSFVATVARDSPLEKPMLAAVVLWVAPRIINAGGIELEHRW